MRELSTFWIIGIILNLGVVIAAFVWLFKIMERPERQTKDKNNNK